MEGTTDGAGAEKAAVPRSPDAWEADTAPQPVLTPSLAALAAAHHHARTAEHHHEAPGGHVEHGEPRHEVPEVPPRRAPWRRVAAIAAAVLLLVGGASAWALTRGSDPGVAAPVTSPTASDAAPSSTLSASAIDPTAAPGITPEAPMLPAGQDTLVLGDSLGLAVYPWFADLVPDRYVSYEAEVGRPTSGTADALDRMSQSAIPPVVVVSSGTNDPDGASLEAAATRILDRLGPDRCVVWVDVVRPDSQYAPASELNAAIDRVAAGRDNVRILQWTELVATHPQWMGGGDGIHPNREGTIGRANAFAAAAESCSPLDPSAPTHRKQVIPLSKFFGPIAGGGSDTGASTGTTTQGVAPAPPADPSQADSPAPVVSDSVSISASASPTPTATPGPSSSSSSTGSATPSPTKTSTTAPAPSSASPSG